MENFLVMVEGHNCEMQFAKDQGSFYRIFGKKKPITKVGFFATRLVVAGWAESAKEIALAHVTNELQLQGRLKNAISEPPTFVISEIRVADRSEVDSDPKGFTFYLDDDRH